MHATKRIALLALSIALGMTGCRSEQTGTAQFAVSMSQALSAASVTRVTVTSSGPGMLSITTELVRTNGVWDGVIGNIPVGSNREFHAQAFDATDTAIFDGTTAGVTISANQTSLVAITLQEANPPPPFSNETPIIQSVVAAPATVQVGGVIAFQSTAQDPNAGDIISFAWTASSGSFANPTHPSTSWTAPNSMGLVPITLTVTDSHGIASSVTLMVNVVNGSGEGSALLEVRFNSWPVVAALSVSPTPLDVGQSTAATVTASDGDGDSLSYQWAATCAGAWVNATSSTASFTPSAIPAGVCNNCQLTATVADGRGGQTTGTVALCVASSTSNTNRFPPLIIRSYQSSLTAQPSQQITLEVTASDPQNNSLTFSWSANSGIPGTPQNTASTSRVVWTAPACMPSGLPASVTATATNAYGLTATRIFELTGLSACPVPVWNSTGSMATARYLHTATLLPHGKVLVAGGWSGSYLASAEVYDPATGAWSPTGTLASARTYHTATLLPNGKVLVAGGYSGSSYLATAEVYDPATGAWSLTGPMLTARYWHTAALLPNGKVLISGGEGSSGRLASAEVYDPATGTWASTGSMASARYNNTATLLPGGMVLVAGGEMGNVRLASAEVYDPATSAWSPTGSMATVRAAHRATLLPSGKVLVSGGFGSSSGLASAEVYNPATGTWTSTGSMAFARQVHTATLLPDGKVLVAGGESTSSAASAEVYDPGTSAWTSTSSMASARQGHTATLLPDGQVLVTGGFGNRFFASAEVYTP